jgi:hypothetical protein
MSTPLDNVTELPKLWITSTPLPQIAKIRRRKK